MPKIFFHPNKILIPQGKLVKINSGITILDAALKNNIKMEHVCEKSCACCTCHCIVKKGFFSLSKCTEQEEDLLDKAWGLERYSRLGCQARIGQEDIEVYIPKYHINQVNENL